ncbi:RND superfamily putative drug exporter [Nonomuraea thailandensis]|uniref:RND superfamily putative drug exporter n=1 Tax=Nonomuraea thailandensis TaxID=1188745 RepID=A0A9X2GFS9_9ACTN|nr:MMPL family transporter [Nonomuraea thailandensis]MCP2356704.1 RND superfamily putative drug exporter [Nonomuraea thailandensis]
MAELLYRLGRFTARRAWWVIAVWVVVLGLAVGAFLAFGGTMSSTMTIPGTPTAQVTDRLKTELPVASGGTGQVVLHSRNGTELTADQRESVSAALKKVADLDGVDQVADPFTSADARAEQAKKIADGLAQVDNGRDQLDKGRKRLDQARTQTEAGIEQTEAGIEQAGQNPQLKATLTRLKATLAQLDKQQAELDEQSATLEKSEQQLLVGRDLLTIADGIRTVSSDGSTATATVVFDLPQQEITPETKKAVTETLDAALPESVTADYSAEIAQGEIQLGGVGEAVGLIVAALVLIIMTGTLVAAGLPILNALFGVGVAVAGAMALSGTIEMTSVTPILGAMLGLAVGIDYALFILHRHRRQLKAGMPVQESIGLANGTSGNAVVFAGSTVLIALLALNITGIPFLALMGTVGAVAIAVAVLLTVTMTPALLGLLGHRLLPRRDRKAASDATGHGEPLAAPKHVQPMGFGSAVLRIVIGVGALALIALPAASMRLGLPTGASEAADSTQYRAYTAITEKFGAGANGPLIVVADLDRGVTGDDLTPAQADLGKQLMDVDGVTAVAPIGANDQGTVLVFQVVPTGGPTSESTEDLVHDLRGRALDLGSGDVSLSVAGSASANLDISEKLADALPAYLAVVVGLSLLILIVVFRSILVPLIATGGFVLSLFAALGGVTAVYQWGWLGSVFGVTDPAPILNFLPTLLVGILFGLAMDYQLFLTSGMREAYAHGAPARQAVTEGVRAGRAVVTAAAVIMISVFGGFMFSHMTMIRPVGFALAFGVLVDAFVVRMLIIPAVMHLAGDKAWWLPRWLDRILPDVDVEGAKLERHHQPAPARVPETAAR